MSVEDLRLAEWIEELEAAGQRFALARALEELHAIRRERAAPHALRVTAERADGGSVQAAVARFLAALGDCLGGHLNTEADATPLLFVESLEFGSIRREVLQKLKALAARPMPLLLLVMAIPARPPSAQRAILDDLLTKVRNERIPLLSIAVCDPEAAGSVEQSAREVAGALQGLRARQIRERLLRAHRRLIFDLRAVATSERLDLQSIDDSIRRIEYEREMVETRLERALRAMRAHLHSELPPMASQILDRMHDDRGALADAVLHDQELFAATLDQIARDATQSVLDERLPVIVARAVEIYSEAAAREADTIARASGEALQSAANLSSESLAVAAHVEADDVLHLIRWHDQVAALYEPAVRKNPKLALIETLIGAAAKLYIAKTIGDAIDELQEPLHRNLMHLAGVLADRTEACLLGLSHEPIQALESALQAERRRRQGALEAAIPAGDIAAALKHHQRLFQRMQEGNGA